MNEEHPKSGRHRVVVHVEPEIAELIPRFLSNLRTSLERGRQALDSRNFEVLQGLGHDAKGTGGGYGFDEISLMGAELEQTARQRDFDGVARCLEQLSAYLTDLEIEVSPE